MTHDSSWQEIRPDVQVVEHTFLPLLSQACVAAGQTTSLGRGRRPTLKWAHLALAIVLHLIEGWSSRLEVWRRICTEPIGPFAPCVISNQDVYERLDHGGLALMQRLFVEVSLQLEKRLAPHEDRRLAPFAPKVLALDESILDHLLHRFAHKETHGHRKQTPKPPPGRISALFNLRTQQWERVDVLPDGKANCKVHARCILAGLPLGTLLLFDRGYTSFSWYDQLSSWGYRYVTRVSHGTSYPLIHCFIHTPVYFDGLVRIGAYRSDHAGYTVRLVRFFSGGTWHGYLSNVLDPLQLSGADVIRLYARRWDIEMAFRVLQDHLHLHTHWAGDWLVLGLQVWASLIVAQMYHALQVEVAREVGVEVFDISLELLMRWVPRWVQQGFHPMEKLLSQGRALGIIRPSRRIVIEVPEVCWQQLSWPPDDVLWWQEPRYAKKEAGNANRKPPS